MSKGKCAPLTTLVSRECIGDAWLMQPVVQSGLVTVADYLTTEERSEVRREYLGGVVYAMTGETRAHNQIIGNLYFHLRRHLQGKPCKLYMSDIRVNFLIREDEYYYYPDLVVTCDARDTDRRFVRYPKLIIEVLSESTERVDRREKFLAYTTIPALEEYALVGQGVPEITSFRRANGWRTEVTAGAETNLTLESLQVALPMAAVYEGV
jgi:Uma2 family endonuclease